MRSSEPGTLLFEIDPTPFRLAVEAAEAELERVGQSFRASTADVAVVQARVTGAEAVLTNSRAQPSACCRRSRSPALPEC